MARPLLLFVLGLAQYKGGMLTAGFVHKLDCGSRTSTVLHSTKRTSTSPPWTMPCSTIHVLKMRHPSPRHSMNLPTVLQAHAEEAITMKTNFTNSSTTSFEANFDYENNPPTLSTLTELFGRNKNRLWGDLNNRQTRKLYHELLPKALLMVEREKGMTLEERAVRASEARNVAKRYARSRNTLPGRVTASLFDGFRHLAQFGYWSWDGMSWEEVWSKYEREIVAEMREVNPELKGVNLTSQISMRILQRR